MARFHPLRLAWIGLMGIVLACSLTTGAAGDESSSAVKTDSSGSAAAAETPEEALEVTLVPDPVTVHAVLDTELAADNAAMAVPGIIAMLPIDGETRDGAQFSLSEFGSLLSVAEDGILEPAFGTVVTITPVSAIDDIPFSRGYLAAVHIAPEGLLMVTPGTLELDVPGVFSEDELVGFAADGTGEDFHLFPVLVIPLSDKTLVTFRVSHFSLYGVAQATAQEILAQKKHTPKKPSNQKDQDLVTLKTPEEIRKGLAAEFRNSLRKKLDTLDKVNCNETVNVAHEFNTWYDRVKKTDGGTEYLDSEIQYGATALASRLEKCLKVTCATCLGGKAGKRDVQAFMAQASFAMTMYEILGDQERVAYWREMMNKCAVANKLPPPSPGLGGDCDDPTVCGPTPTPLKCPAK